MKKVLSFIMIAMVCAVAHSQIKYLDLTTTGMTLNNVEKVVNADGSVTFSLIDDGANGTVRFDEITDFTPYATFNYSNVQSTATNGAVSYEVGGVKPYRPYETLTSTQQVLVSEMTTADNTAFVITLRTGAAPTVTLSKVYVLGALTTNLSDLTYYTYSTKGGEQTTTKNTLASSITLTGNSNVIGSTSDLQFLPGKYYELGEYDKIQLQIEAPATEVGKSFTMRYLFLKDELNADQTQYVLDNVYQPITLTGGKQIVELDLSTVPAPKRLAFIQAQPTSGNTQFNIDYCVVIKNKDTRAASEAGAYGTICLPVAATVTNATIFEVAGVDNKTTPSALYLQAVEGNAMTAGIPYIYQAIEAGEVTFSFAEGSSYANTALSANGLVGIYNEGTMAPQGSYVLSTGYKWYLVDAEEGFASGANRAYLNLDAIAEGTAPQGVATRTLDFDSNGATGITVVDEDANPLVDVYTIQGVKVRSQVEAAEALNGLTKGIYIVNGKKVAVL